MRFRGKKNTSVTAFGIRIDGLALRAVGPQHSVIMPVTLSFLPFLAAACCLLPPAAAVVRAQDAPAPAAVSAESLAIPATDDGLPGAGPIRRMKWFRDLWSQRRVKWAAETAKDQGALVFLGDSITQGWGDDLGGAFAGAKIANRGISGDTTRGMLIRLKEDVLALHPKGVVLLAGTNDLEEGAEPETIAANLRLIMDALWAQDPKMPVVICKVFPSSATKSRPAEKIRKLNDLCAASVKTEPRATVVDTWRLFANPAGDAKAEEFPDLLHPNAAGYSKWAAAIRPVLATLGFVETAPDTFKPEEGFVSLFNGHDLTGWSYRDKDGKVTAFDGLEASADGRYVARNGRLVVTTPSEGSRIAGLWTVREFPENFTMKLEFRATPTADSGIFIRRPQLQCRDYALAGPYKTLTGYKPQDWNEITVKVRGGTARCLCNGEVLEEALAVPPTGPIGLEGDSGQMVYRRFRLKVE